MMMPEQDMVEKYCTAEFIEKTFAKVSADGWSSRQIPQLLGTVWHDFIQEEIWQILKEYKNPKIDFKAMNQFVILKIKKTLEQIF
jgi:hypothetical protein